MFWQVIAVPIGIISAIGALGLIELTKWVCTGGLKDLKEDRYK